MDERLDRQLNFVIEADKLKSVCRRTLLTDRSRAENPAEHSWHLALMVLLLNEHAAAEGLDVSRMVEMALVHDLVEIYAGDTYVYDTEGQKGKEARESEAAGRLFGLLPEDQGAAWRACWEQFEARESPEAKFVAALDRLQPLMLNVATGGESWREHGIVKAQVLERNRQMADGAPAL